MKKCLPTNHVSVDQSDFLLGQIHKAHSHPRLHLLQAATIVCSQPSHLTGAIKGVHNSWNLKGHFKARPDVQEFVGGDKETTLTNILSESGKELIVGKKSNLDLKLLTGIDSSLCTRQCGLAA